MAFFGSSKKIEETPSIHAGPPPQERLQQPASQTRVSGRPIEEMAPAPQPLAAAPLAFGIDHAIQLMRAVPLDQNSELVVSVMKTTLESLNVRVTDIVRDAVRRQKELEARVGVLKGEISTLEREMEARVAEIVRLEAAHSETSMVKQRLEQADKSRGESHAPRAPAPARAVEAIAPKVGVASSPGIPIPSNVSNNGINVIVSNE